MITTIIARPGSGQQVKALKAFMKALKIAFEEQKEEQPYDPAFVQKVEESRREAKEGKVTRLKKEDITTYLGL